MQKTALRLLLLLMTFIGSNVFAYAGDATPRKGVIRVKLQPEVALQVGATPRMQTAGVLKTGVTPLDASTKAIKAYSIRRAFPYAPKYEAQRAKYGLDRWYEISFDESVSTAQALSVLKNTAGVQHAHGIVPMELKENATFRKMTALPKASASAMPFNDPRLPAQWHYHNDGSLAQSKAGADINLFEAWNITTGSDKVVVAIIDGGIDLSHEDLSANIATNAAELNGQPGVDDDGNGYIDDIYGWNFCTNSAEIYPHDHGTHVAGTVAAVNNNGVGVAGVAGGNGTPGSGVKMISVQVFDPRSGSGEADFAEALIYAAERGATIAQCSWGWASADYKEQSVLDAIDYFTKTARSDNMTGGLCIFAAGNEGSTGNWYPGCYEPVLSVAAMNDDLTPSSYSNYGEWVDVVAPGGLLDYGDSHGVLSTLPENSYGFSEGTSMATPHVSGIAALFLSKHGKSTMINETLRQQLVTSVNDFYTVNPQAKGLFGSGYVDAAKALVMGDGSAPEAVKALSAYPGQDNITLGWIIPASSDNNVNNHILYYSTTAFDASSDLSSVNSVVIDTKFLASGDSTTYELTGLSSLTTYHLAIKAVNRWGDASALSPVVTATTNAGPKMTVDKKSLSLNITATNQHPTATFNIGNEDEGLLRWNGIARTTQSTIATYSMGNRPFVSSAKPFSGKIGTEKAVTHAVVKAEGYNQDEYPKNFAYFDSYYASIGEADLTLPNSAAQWFYVDADEYPEGFNLTAVKKTSYYGEAATVQIYKGSSLTPNNLVQEIVPDYFYSDMVIKLTEQIYFAPGESFWVVYHFPAQATAYPLGLATAKDEDHAGYSYMSNDMGKTWVKLTDALKGSPYEILGDNVSWAITAMSQNPDWSEILVLNPAEGTVKQGETQAVELGVSSEPIVNGTYKFNLRFNTNESEANKLTIPVTLSVKGNVPVMKGPKIVDFGNLLVGQEKTLTVEVYNEGYGPFSYYGSLSGNKITCSSANFKAPTYISGGFPARAISTFDVTFAPQEAGSLTGVLTFNNGSGVTYSITLQGVATEPAKIVVDPAEITVGDLTVGGEAVKATFSVKNEGKYPLEYVFPKFSDETIEGSTSKAHKFGYTAITNLNGATGFAYDGNPELIGATDITSSFSDDNYFSKEISLGFAFPFYGKTYETIYINSFGGLQFGIAEYELRSPVSESAYGTENVGYISAYGYQLQFGPESKVEYAKQDGKFVVKYSNVLALVYDQEYAPVSFRIALSSNGDVEIFYDNYDAMSLFQGGSTLYCGILDKAREDALTVTSADIADYWGTNDDPAGDVYNYFTNQTAVKFVAPKPNMVTSLSSTSGVVNPGESAIIEATLVADDTMNAGENFNNIVILSNDPVNGTSFVKFVANIVGDALLPVAALDNNAIDFGKVFRTSDTKVAVTVKNTGKKVMNVTDVKTANAAVTFEAQVPFAIEPGMSKDIVVTIPTDKEGAVADVMTITTDAGEVTANISGEVIGVPTLDLSYTEITEELVSGAELNKPLTITNNGNETLTYSITPNPEYYTFSEELTEDAKVSYTYNASVDGQGVSYNWIDIETNGLGEQNNFTYYNNSDFVAVELPFEFPFYGKKYNKMYIYNTGFVSFTARDDQKMWPEPPATFPGGTIYTNVIAPYWGLHTMDQSKTAGTYHYVTEEQAVISWMEYGNTMNMGVCYQLIMRKDGSFKFQYKGYGDYAIIYSVFGLAGLSNEDGTEGVKIPERYVQFGNAVEFTPVTEISVPAGENRTVNIDIVTDKMAGVYNNAIKVNSNVPGKEKVEIPLNLSITGVAKPVFPTDTIIVERIIGSYDGYREDLPNGGVSGMGANYEAAIKIENQGTAAFTITNVINGGPSVYDDWFDMYSPLFQTWYYAPELDWMTGEPTGNYAWSQYYDYTPVTVDNNGTYFTVPMIDYMTANTPGVYDVPMTFCYNENDTAVVHVRFIVTDAPVATLDKSEIRVTNATADHKSIETVTLSNVGRYKLTYELRMDPTGVGEQQDDLGGGGGIAPMAENKQAIQPLSVADGDLLRANIKSEIVPMATSTNTLEAPQDFEYNSALFYPAMPGVSTAYQYGTGNTYGLYKIATAFVAPEEGFNVSHIYTAVYVADLKNVDLNVEVIRGGSSGEPTTGTVVGKGTFHIDEMEGARFVIIPLDKAVYMNPGEEFHVVVTYPVGVEYPSFLSYKEEAVVSNRYMCFVEGYGWFDVATMFKDQYGSLGHILTCLETVSGDAWVKLLNEATTGTLAALADGQDGTGGGNGNDGIGGMEPLSTSNDATSVELQIQIDASAAPLVKGNKAVLVIKTSDPSQPIINFPIYLDKNGAPAITTTEGTVYAKEAETTLVNVAVMDEDGDDFTLTFSDPSALASVKAVTAANAEATIETAEDGTISVKGATEGVNVEIAITPNYGDAGKYAFTLVATDANANESQAVVNYEVEHVNRAPEAIDIEDVQVVLDGVTPIISFENMFNEPDGEEMTYNMTVSSTGIVTPFTTETGVIFVGTAIGEVTVTVVATDVNGATASNSFKVIVTEPSGIDENSLNAKVEVYPNPVAETLYVTCDFSAKETTYAIYAANGALVYSSKSATAQGEAKAINVAELAEGVYILQLTTENGMATFHVVKK